MSSWTSGSASRDGSFCWLLCPSASRLASSRIASASARAFVIASWRLCSSSRARFSSCLCLSSPADLSASLRIFSAWACAPESSSAAFGSMSFAFASASLRIFSACDFASASTAFAFGSISLANAACCCSLKAAASSPAFFRIASASAFARSISFLTFSALRAARFSASRPAALTMSLARARACSMISSACDSAPSRFSVFSRAAASVRAFSRICSAWALASAVSLSASARYSSRMRAATSSRRAVASLRSSSALAFAWATVLL